MVNDNMTRWHEENREHFEGWKSNDCWRINKRVIIPNCAEERGYDNWGFSYHKDSEVDDIDRALCLVTGKNFDNILTVVKSVRGAYHSEKETQSEFFKIRMFK